MAEHDFVHLHVHTQYSLLDGAIRLDSLFKKAKEFGMHSVAITDHGTMFGVFEFWEIAKKYDIKPIIGCECYVAPRTRHDKTQIDAKGMSHLVLLAENQEGYVNLCRLASLAQLEGFYYKPRVDKDALKEHSEGVIALSACLHGEIPLLLNAGKVDQADEAARFYQETFGEDSFFLELQNNGLEIQERVNRSLLEMSQRLSIPIVATNDCHYMDKKDIRAHEVLLCVQTGKTMNDPNRFKFGTDQLYFKSKEDMAGYFGDYPDALANTVKIASRCNVEFDTKTYHFPQYETDEGLEAADLFAKRAREGFAKLFEIIKKKNPEADEKLYLKRLEYEVEVINKMGFPGYFLIVSDFIQFAKRKGIPVGPGRGSAAGSLVAYSLRITDLDPIEHGLIFERFLNPGRISMPDIDVDFCINGREEVFKYVMERYGGGEYVAQIITFGKMKSRAVIRDVGRALDVPLREVDVIAKLIPEVLGIKLKDALTMEPKLKALYDEQAHIRELVDISLVLEGLTRHASVHAAGVVVSDKPLTQYLPVYKGKKDEVVTQFDMHGVETIGLVKFDFLGLRNLTVIQGTVDLIEHQGKMAPDVDNLDFEDKATYELLAAGDTTGVFQLESSGMKNLLVRMAPNSFSDIVALVALYRPGPLDSGMADTYVERKNGRMAVEYMTPELESILKETYGVILYQEQVMKIASVLASYDMGEADGLRKAMGKKIAEKMAEHRIRFTEGAKENNISMEISTKIYDLMETFGGYGFNKSHSAAYALIAFQTAYLKAHYMVEFLAAILTSQIHNIDGVVKYIAECASHDIEVLPPDINESVTTFTVKDGKIRFGLVAVKNVGEGAIETIIAEREENGNFASLFEFCERVDLRKVNKRVLESLIKCGAFDSTGARRAQIWACLEDAIDYGQMARKERLSPQRGLFDDDDLPDSIKQPPMPEIPEWDRKQLLNFEKEALGFYISGHPLGSYKELIDLYANHDTISIKELADESVVRVPGILTSVKKIMTKKNDPMAFITTEDTHGSVETIVFTSVYAVAADVLVNDTPVFILGRVQKSEEAVQIIADTIIPIEQAPEFWTASVHINLDVGRTQPEVLKELYQIVKSNPGSCRSFIGIRDAGKTETIIALPEELKLRNGKGLRRSVNALLGYDAVETKCTAAAASIAPKKEKKYGRR